MKINWGTSLVLAIASFICFILFLVITMTTNTDLDHDLVTEDYYSHEIGFQEQLNKQINSQSLSNPIRVQRTADGILIDFPQEISPKSINGKVRLYRPSNKELDFEIPISLSSHQLLVPDQRFVGGRWNIEIDWNDGIKDYLLKHDLTY